MPWKSKAQMRLFYAKNKRGEIGDEDLEQWKSETPNIKALPERLKKKKGKTHAKLASVFEKFMAVALGTQAPILGQQKVGRALREARSGSDRSDGRDSGGAEAGLPGRSKTASGGELGNAGYGHGGFDRGFGRAWLLPEACGVDGSGVAKTGAREGNLVDEAEEEENAKDFTHTVKGSQLKKDTAQAKSSTVERERSGEKREYPQSMRHLWRSSRG